MQRKGLVNECGNQSRHLAAKANGLKQKILLVDDDAAIRQILMRLLTEEDYLVLTAANGVEALVLAESAKFDLVLLDLNMPVKDGWETFEQLFIGFALGLNSATTVQFVGGGEEMLSKWLAGTITQNQVIGDSAPIEEETHWELFLRRAGMNAFAAQAILADLKEPEGVDPRSPSKAGLFGLTAFVEMGVEQRITRFGPLCGRGLIERASAVIDADWQSQTEGLC